MHFCFDEDEESWMTVLTDRDTNVTLHTQHNPGPEFEVTGIDWYEGFGPQIKSFNAANLARTNVPRP